MWGNGIAFQETCHDQENVLQCARQLTPQTHDLVLKTQVEKL